MSRVELLPPGSPLPTLLFNESFPPLLFNESAPQSGAALGNFTNSKLPMAEDDQLITIGNLALGIAFGVIVALGILGNLLVVYVIMSRQAMRHVWNLLLLNLALADVIFLATCGTFTTLHYVTRHWPMGGAVCRLTQYLMYVTCYVSIYTLVAISAFRYYVTAHGRVGAGAHAARKVTLTVVGIWIFFLLTMVVIPVTHGVNHHPQYNLTECHLEGYGQGQALYATFFVTGYVLPLSAVSLLYVMLLRFLRRHPLPGDERKTERRNAHVTRLVTCVTLTFALCWLPLHVHLLLGSAGRLPTHAGYTGLSLLWHALIFLSATLDPLLYNCLSSEFRDSFRDVLCGPCRSKVKGRGSKGTPTTTRSSIER